MMGVLNGVVMEIQDCAMPLVRNTVATDDPNVAFKDIDAAFLVGAMPRKEGMERKDLLAANVKIFKVQGEALDKFAKKSVKVRRGDRRERRDVTLCSSPCQVLKETRVTVVSLAYLVSRVLKGVQDFLE